MNFKNVFKTSFKGLKTHKSRSALTILGIVIGIAAIILLMSLGKGAEGLIVGQIQGMGSKTIIVEPGREPKGPTDFIQVLNVSLKERDLELLSKKVNVPSLNKIMPIVFGSESGAYLSETYRLTIFGASPLISEIFDLVLEQGLFFSEEDVLSRTDVAVIGAKVKNELFGDSDAIGQKIKIKGRNFKVLGLLSLKGQASLFNFDDIVIVPYTTAQQYIFGIKNFHRFVIEAVSEAMIPQTVQDIELTLRSSHNITDISKDDFHIHTQTDIMERLGIVTDIFTLFSVSVAAISLVVGGIGIMNIMLVSVTERTREIGLRKALGATDKDIMFQFLLEAMILTTIGGLIGVMFGAGLAFVASFVLSQFFSLGWVFIFPISAALLGLVVSGFIGLLFGIYPARKAALKSPIEALRYE